MPTTGDRSATYAGGGLTYAEVQDTDEFQGLKRTLRRFIFPATVLFLAWYVLYILLTAYARGFMATKLLGNINIAYVLGLAQFISTFVIAFIYSRYADKHFDPTADSIRQRLEAPDEHGTGEHGTGDHGTHDQGGTGRATGRDGAAR